MSLQFHLQKSAHKNMEPQKSQSHYPVFAILQISHNHELASQGNCNFIAMHIHFENSRENDSFYSILRKTRSENLITWLRPQVHSLRYMYTHLLQLCSVYHFLPLHQCYAFQSAQLVSLRNLTEQTSVQMACVTPRMCPEHK